MFNIVKSELGDVGYYATTTDMWASLASSAYMAYTVHWISKEFQLKSRSLQVCKFDENG